MPRPLSRVGRTAACVFGLACAVLPAALGQSSVQAPVQQPPPRHTVLDPAVNRPPDANKIMVMREQQARKVKFEAANIERKRQLDEDSALLVKLAGELKLEVGASTSNAVEPELVRKLEEIERLAHNVQQKMKLTMGAS